MCMCVSVCECALSVMSDFSTPWTVALQVPLLMKFSRQVYWSRLPFSSPGDLADPGIKPVSLASPALALFLPLHLLGSLEYCV